MAIIKCKMCGGDIVLAEDKTYGTCEYCGSTMTFPKVSDEQKLNLFNRANHFRRQNEFDKAIAAYDKILDQDDTDAEAHWGAVLSRYGIEYVEDPVTHERIPTCHRVQLGSILTDADYLAALEHAPDTASRDLYESEAKRIADIQKGILAISAQEKPYDVFICYKETDDSGSRTKDSTLAQDIYYQLTNEGYKVFFSRITLEDKLGQQYEPYIFAALNSAKVMLVIGTRAEYFNAVWVKNEWNRYLDLMKRDRNKLLIPCYRDMDPYDLPEELSALQSQDMSKIGFMQDIIRGVKKVLQKDEVKPQIVAQPTATTPAAAPANNVAPLLKRAFMFLEDGDFARANDFCEQVLNLDPEDGRAYLGKLMVDLQVRKESDLKNQPQLFEDNGYYQKIMRFGNDALKKQVKSDIDFINNRNEYARQQEIFYQACNMLQNADKVEQCLEAKRQFEGILRFNGAKEMLAQCDAKAESINKKNYDRAREHQNSGRWQNAIIVFEMLGDYRDSRERLQTCREILEKENKAEEQRREQERHIAERKAKAEAEKNRRIAIIAVTVAAVVLASVLLYSNVIKPNGIYNSALKAMKAGNYDEATAIFESLGDYKDAATQALESQYQKGVTLLASGDYDGASTAFIGISGYNDAATQAQESQYQKGTVLFDAGDYDGAANTFNAISNYRDAATQAQESWYQEGLALTKEDKGYPALCALRKAGRDYKDTSEHLTELESIVVANAGRIAAGDSHTVGLKSDGTVFAVGENKYNQCDTGDWKDIVAVAAGGSHTVGLKSDGTVLAVGDNVVGQCDTGTWKDIVAVAAGGSKTIGLKSNGTVRLAGAKYRKYDIGNWKDIVAVAAGERHIVGLKSDDTVIAVGDDYYGDLDECDTGDWKDIVAVAAGHYHTVGLKSDGTVVAVGSNKSGQCDTGDWKDIVAVAAGYSHTVGLKSDGTVFAVGNNSLSRGNTGRWHLWG